MAEAIEIRAARAADEAALNTLWEEFEAEVPEPAHRTPETWEQAWAEIGARIENGLALLAETAGGRPLAYALARPDGAGIYLLDTIYVRPEARRGGLAKRLLAGVADWALARGGRALTLEVLETNVEARDGYDRLGFEPESHMLFSPLDALRDRLTGARTIDPERFPTLAGPQLRLRPGAEADVPPLLAILAEPEVARWWGLPESAETAASLLRKLGGVEDGVLLVVEVDGQVAGGIEYWEEHDPDYRHAGIDVYLGTAWQGRRLGREAVGLLARFLLEVRGHHRLTIDPSAANERAIRCYEAVGFRRVGVMRAYERGPDGAWRDGLLLDLLAGELR